MVENRRRTNIVRLIKATGLGMMLGGAALYGFGSGAVEIAGAVTSFSGLGTVLAPDVITSIQRKR